MGNKRSRRTISGRNDQLKEARFNWFRGRTNLETRPNASAHVAADHRCAGMLCAYGPCPRTRHGGRLLQSVLSLVLCEGRPTPPGAARPLGAAYRASLSGINERIAARRFERPRPFFRRKAARAGALGRI